MDIHFSKFINKIKEFYSCLRAGEKAFNYPEVILVELTSRCNLNCQICIKQRITKRDKVDMPFETFKNITRDILPFLSKVTFAGFGEPLLNKDTLRIIRYVHDNGIKTFLITNGTLLSKQVSQELLDSGLNRISVSLDTVSEERYKKLRGWELPEILTNIRGLRDLKKKNKRNTLKILVNNTLVTENLEELPEMVKLAYALEIDGVDFGLADEVDLDFKENSLLNYDNNKLEDILREGIEADKNNISNLRLLRKGLMSPSLYNIQGHRGCYSPWGYMLIMADGEVMPCCRPFNYYLGRLGVNNFQGIWNGPGYRAFRRNLVSGTCCNKCILNVKLNNLKLYALIKNICRLFPVMRMFSKRRF